MQSLQAKLGSGLILSLIAVFTGLWLLISFNIRHLAEEYIASRLRHDAEMLLGSLSFDGSGQLRLDEKAINPVYNQPFSGHYYRLQAGQQSLSSRSLWDQQLNITPLKTGEQSRAHQAGPNRQLLLVVNNGFTKQGHALSISVAEDLNPVWDNMQQFQRRFAISAVACLLLLVILQAFILKRSLKSLTRIRTDLQSLQQGETRQLNSNVPMELRPLINEINHLLGIMDQRLRRSRDALGDLAHTIKKPLTVMQQLLDRHRYSLTEEIGADLVRQTLTINQLTDRILKRARLAGQVYSGALFSFAKDLPALIETLDMMYRDKKVTVQITMPDEIDCPIDREDMLELLGNILDNAYKWARQTVRINIALNTALTLRIEDDGPGADAGRLSQLDMRGIRLDESTPGYGFGLAIAADMVREYQGSISFGRSDELGGFRVDIRLPLDRRTAI